MGGKKGEEGEGGKKSVEGNECALIWVKREGRGERKRRGRDQMPEGDVEGKGHLTWL